MKKYSNQIIVIVTFIILILIFFNKSLVSDTIISSFYIWFNTLVPSMFPMFVTSNILISYNFIMYIPRVITSFFSKLFNISKEAVLVLFISLIAGFPNNAMAIRSSYDMKLISKLEAEHLLLICHFANPLFVLETIGVFYLKNNMYGIIILISHILSNIIIGIIFRNKNIPTSDNYISKNTNCQSFGALFSLSIKKSVNTLFMIFGIVTSFLIVSTLICHILVLDDYLSVLVKAVLEMTMGLSSLSLLNISDIYKVIISSMIISFGGLSIHMQVISILDDKIRYRNYFIGRLYQVFLSIIFSAMFFKLFA